MDIYRFFADHDIEYERCDHPPVFTCEEANRLVPPMRGTKTKNLFLRDKKGRRHFLVAVGYEKRVDLKALSSRLGISGLSLASPERLMRHLGVEPGAVSLLGVVNDADAAVEVVMDEGLWAAEALQCHPLVNTSSVVISREDLERLMEITGHPVQVLDVPDRG